MNKADKAVLFTFYWRALGDDAFTPEDEYRFAKNATPPRQFRFDWSFKAQRVAVEIDGGNFEFTAITKDGRKYKTRGRHSNPVGIENDNEKFNLATELGWRVLRFTTQVIEKNPTACIEQVLRVLRQGAMNDEQPTAM